MQFSQEYDILGTLSEGNTTRVFRARDTKTGERVVLKILGDEYPEPDILSRFRYEYELTRKLAAQTDKVLGVGKLRKQGHRLFMELQDIGGKTLASEIASEGPCLGRLDRALAVALHLARALSDLHQANVIHLGLCPKHILLDPRNDAVKIIDFGQASELTLENAEAAYINLPLDLLQYIAPEQSGRMNRTIDRRADLYSLGATLYHLFTGHAPFEDTGGDGGAVALIHAHIAQAPIAAAVLNPDLPEAVSQVVHRLLEKSVNDRYQSAAGLAADLERCLSSLRETGKIADFELASADYLDRLTPAQRLYGREAEKRLLSDCFERCRNGASEMVFVMGFSGIGKTSLVNELQRPVALANGHFVSGKFDVTQRDQPYFAFLQALRACVSQQLLTSSQNIEDMAQAFRAALGPNGKIITDVIPEVEIFIGPQPVVPELGAEETQNRFSRVMENFLQTLASPASPLVMFIDDLQWADTPSLNLLRRIMAGGQIKHVLIVGAYRDNEVSMAHPVSLLQQSFEEQKANVGYIELKPITKEDVADLISEVIRRPVNEIEELADLCFDKTGGNPFFLNQFLDALGKDKVLRFDYQKNTWEWDALSISKSDYADNVVELVLARIRRMPEDAVHVLKVASCIGSRFDLQALVDIMDQPQQVLTGHLWALLKERLVLPMSDRYRMAHDEGKDSLILDVSYRFLHDRVQQAAYSLQTDEERAQNHLLIARKFRASLSEDSPRKIWFDVTSHFNNATDLIKSEPEKWQLARLNLEAARRAKETAAFESAAQYLQKGLAALPQDAWEVDYDLTLDLHIEATDTAYLTRAFAQMNELAQTTEREAKDFAAILRLRDVELRALISQDHRVEAISKALPLLADLGAPFVTEPTFDDYGAAFAAAEGALAGRDVADLINLPDMHDENARAAMRILCLIFSAAYFAAPQYMPLIIAKLVELSGRHGNTEESAFGYAVYGLNLCAFQNDFERGFEFGELSRAVLDRFDARGLRARTLFIANICITHWKRHINATLEPLLEAYQSGLDTGDTEYATHALMIHNQHLYAIGHPLGILSTRMAGQRNTIENSKEEAAFSLFMIYQQTIENWRIPGADPSVLTGSCCDEAILRAESEEIGDRTALFHMHYNKTILAYSFSQYEDAKALAEKTRDLLDGAAGVHQIPIFHFYESLVLLANDADPDEERIAENQANLDQWAAHCPDNQRHRWHLVEAIRAERRGKVVEAIGHFDTSTSLAQQNGYVQEEALVHELHGRFWLGQGNRTLAGVFLQKADRCLAHWGGEAKRQYLTREFEGLASDPASGKSDNTTSAQTIDIETVTKSAQAITESTGLTDLLSQMMQITMQNAGAQRGLLLLNRSDHMASSASASSGGPEIELSSDISIESLDETETDLPLLSAAARYVVRTGRDLVLDDAHADATFGNDPYVQQNKIRSVLCMLLKYQGQIVAVLYLENNLSAGAFTVERLELLNLLSGQMAVAIKNAQHLEDVLRINRAYERFVPKQFLGILGRDSIVDVQLGDQVSREMTVMFLDIRDFTKLSENMSPEEIFIFINGFLQAVEPQVSRHGGIIDKYTGDGLMALFPSSADDAVRSGIDILAALKMFNARRADVAAAPINIGIGLHSGRLMLGTIGGQTRMDGTVISAVVNQASRIEGLNREFGTQILVSASTVNLLYDPDVYQHRKIGRFSVKGGIDVTVYEIFDGDPPERIALKRATRVWLYKAMTEMEAGNVQAAREGFEGVLSIDPHDQLVRNFHDRLRSDVAIHDKAS